MPEAEVQRRLLAQISSRGLLKRGHRIETSSLGNTLLGHGTTASPAFQNGLDSTLRTQQQQQLQQQHLIAEATPIVRFPFELVSRLLHCCPALL